MAIRHAGANIVWADVAPRSGNMSPESLAERLTARTRAIMVVHYGGVPASMKKINEIADARGVPVIEDAAHALGARYAGRPIGAGSALTMFSLQAIKHLTTVDGGMLACRAPQMLPNGRRIRWFGIDRQLPRTEVDVTEIGYKYHMNNVNATIGLVQLDHIDAVIARHVSNGKFFNEALRAIPGLELCRWDAEAEPTYWFYTVLCDKRADLARLLADHGIASSLVHRRNDLHTVFASSRRDLPGLDSFYGRMLHIPCGWWVSDEDRERIASVIRKGW
jgi:dTDP-4-amino-4,6-dideoxygalactose transaminase